MSGKVIDGPVTIRGDLVVTGRLNKGLDTAQQMRAKRSKSSRESCNPW